MARITSKAVFTGGGTAGHVFPAFPVIQSLKHSGCDILWIGSKHGIERALVQAEGIRYIAVPAGKLRRYFSPRNFIDLFRIAAGFFRSLLILRRERPCFLFSKGGFVSCPPAAAAAVLGIPAFTHESDIDPGLATRLNMRFGAVLLASYPDTLEFIAPRYRSKALVTGNPVRDALFSGSRAKGRVFAGLDAEDPRPLVLVLGGSQGAGEINSLIFGCLDDLLITAALVHQTGPRTDVPRGRRGYTAAPFFGEELSDLMAAADLVISRAGAGALWELAASGTPGILIPLRRGTRGDQIRNAALAEERGMALMLGSGAPPDELYRLIRELLNDPRRLETMAQAARRFPCPEIPGGTTPGGTPASGTGSKDGTTGGAVPARQAAPRIIDALKDYIP